MTLSVIIPVYGPWQPQRVLPALLALQPLEILVVDSSPVPTPLPELPSLHLVHLKERAFPGAARNAGWRKAQGDYLLFVDADVLLTESARQFVQEHMAASADDLAFGLYSPRTNGDNAITRALVSLQRRRFGEECLRHDWRYGQSSHLLLRREHYSRLGYFNPQLRMHEDKELSIRAQNAGIAVNVYPAFEAEHLKIFSLPSLLRDHFDKAFLATAALCDNPAIFQRVSNQFGWGGTLSFIGAAVLPPLLFMLAMTGLLPLGVALLLFGLNALQPALLCRRVFQHLAWGDRLAALLLWPFMGGAMVAGAGLARLHHIARLPLRGLRHAQHLLQLGWRVLRRDGMPVALIHFVTARCNLRCEHCFYKETLDKPDPGEIPLTQLEKTTREIGPMLWYALAGGEPFVRGDLPQVCALISRHCRPLALTIPSNGWYSERTFLKVLDMLQNPIMRPLTIQISVDGPATMHDAIRGPGSWQRLCDTLSRLHSLRRLYPQRLSLGIITVVNDHNAHVYPDFIDTLVADFQPNQISINLVRPNQLGGPAPLPATVTAWEQAVSHYESRVAEGRLPNLSYWGGRVVRAKEAVQKRLIQRVTGGEFATPCTAGSLIYTLWEDGRLGPCEMLPDSLGNVLNVGNNGDFRRLVQSETAQTLRRRIRDEQCKCTYECANTVNTLFNAGPAFSVARGVLQPSRAKP